MIWVRATAVLAAMAALWTVFIAAQMSTGLAVCYYGDHCGYEISDGGSPPGAAYLVVAGAMAAVGVVAAAAIVMSVRLWRGSTPAVEAVGWSAAATAGCVALGLSI